MTNTEEITHIAIHPAIGIARVGNSPDAYFLGPQTPGHHPNDPTDFRDPQGRFKRQGVEFRLFGYNKAGEVVRELSAADGKINWTVHVANKKAAWYKFSQALDIPASMGTRDGSKPVENGHRNDDIKGSDRTGLTIDPGPRHISGCYTNHDGSDSQFAFDTGEFMGKPVYLGELRTNRTGNLIFLGGHGHSAAYDNQPTPGFGNNPGWHDDTSDGPVDATIELNGRLFHAAGAWVITAPPNYAPGVQAFSTGYDLLYDVAARQLPSDSLPKDFVPEKPRFYREIWPILIHITQNQWVNAGVAREYGWGSPADFNHKTLVARLNDASDANRPLRQAIFGRFRNPNSNYIQSALLPPLYGDAVTMQADAQDPNEWFALPRTHYRFLQQWADGNFIVDTPPPVYKQLDKMPLLQRPAAMDKAMLEETLGGPFHPGCEFTWPMRHGMMYDAPFRIKRRSSPEPDYGPVLNSKIALADDGPLNGSTAGDITRWMATPWQTDTASCLSSYVTYGGEYLPTFWPARVPNDVLTQASYQTLLSKEASVSEKEQAFSIHQRRKWLRGLSYNNANPAQMVGSNKTRREFVDAWPKMGVVVRKPLPVSDEPLFPHHVWVETGRTFEEKPHMKVSEFTAADLPLKENR